ncbi:hypothetical protein [Sphingomonas sp.]|uniref:hypothetical protein n=1 Tax=Sphingomonas sp. TaxID=28214 RepID=UPI00389E9E21
MDTEPRQQPIPDKGTHDPDQQVADNSEPRTPNDFAGQPARNDADEQYDQQAFVRQMHWSPLDQGHHLTGLIVPIGNVSISPQFLGRGATRWT